MVKPLTIPEVVSVGNDLVSNILWLGQDGSMTVGNHAYECRKAILAIDPGDFEGTERKLVLRLKKAVGQTVGKSCLHWNADEIDRFVVALSELKGVMDRPAPSVAKSRSIPVRFEKAYRSFEVAERKIKESEENGLASVSDKEAYKWLREHGIAEYELPIFENWGRYLRGGRLYYQDQKNVTCRGRTSRSAHPLGAI